MVVPSLNCTVPAAVAGVIVAVNFTTVPWTTGETGDVISSVVVVVGAMTLVAWKVLRSDVALAAPVMKKTVTTRTAAASKARATSQWSCLLIRMTSLHFPVSRQPEPRLLRMVSDGYTADAGLG
jgi:hypothetical protein